MSVTCEGGSLNAGILRFYSLPMPQRFGIHTSLTIELRCPLFEESLHTFLKIGGPSRFKLALGF